MRLQSVEVRLSKLEYHVVNIEATVTQLQSAMSFYQAKFGGPPSLPGFGASVFPGSSSVPGFGHYYHPPYGYNQPASASYCQYDWSSFTAE